MIETSRDKLGLIMRENKRSIESLVFSDSPHMLAMRRMANISNLLPLKILSHFSRIF
jgi:hypothetical protein